MAQVPPAPTVTVKTEPLATEKFAAVKKPPAPPPPARPAPPPPPPATTKYSTVRGEFLEEPELLYLLVPLDALAKNGIITYS
jgi:hypothetical protein